MGNRIGLHAALSQFSHAFIYFSSASHYSVKKTIRDCDTLTNNWNPGRVPRAAEVPADEYGRMIPAALLQQVQADRAECVAHNESYQLVLFANLGTTFVGGRDDLREIRQSLSTIGVTPAYVHVDGALDLGFQSSNVRLGPPSTDASVVQGITLSHHKVLGTMVSGEVICYSPPSLPSGNSSCPTPWFPTTTIVDPRAVLELHLIDLLYPPDASATLENYCRSNAKLLRDLLRAAGIPTLSNPTSLITCFPRPPPWIFRTFHLAPEGDWVHAITMPHVGPASVRNLVRALTRTEEAFETAFEYMLPSGITALSLATGRSHSNGGSEWRLARLVCRCPYVDDVLRLVERARSATRDEGEDRMRVASGLSTGKAFMERYVYGAMSVVMLDKDETPAAVFLAQASGDHVVVPGPIVVNSERVILEGGEMLTDVARTLFEHIATLLNARIEGIGESFGVFRIG